MLKKFLEIRLHTSDKSGGKTEIKCVYRVDLYTLAIGPIHHTIELLDKVKNQLVLKYLTLDKEIYWKILMWYNILIDPICRVVTWWASC